MTLVKKDLVRAVARASRLRVGEAAQVVDRLLLEVTRSLAAGESVEIRGFGSLKARRVSGRVGRDMRRGKSIALPDKVRVSFRAGRALKARAVVEPLADKSGQYALFREGGRA